MPLKIFNAENTVVTSVKKLKEPAFRVNNRGGLFSINGAAASATGIEEGSLLEFAQDEAMKTTWFFRVVKEKGIEVKKRKEFLCFNNPFLSREIISSFPKTDNVVSVSLKVQQPAIKIEGKSYWRFEFLDSKLKKNKKP